jgi:hypothetical protein
MKRAAWLLAGAGFLIAPALAADLSGTWEIQGPVDPVCIFTQQGNALAGTCRGPAAEGPVTGTVDGDAVRWTFTRTNRAGNALPPVEFSGSVSGENLTGTASFGGRGGAFTARRIQGAAAPAGAASAAPSSPAPAGPYALTTTPPRSVFDMDADRSAVHQQSRLVCPASVTGFPRISVMLVDRWGFDVACSYRNAGGSVITLYVYRALGRASFDEDYEGARISLSQVMAGAQPRKETGITPPGAGWRSSGYVLPNGIFTELFLSPLADWRFKYRLTYAPQDAGAVSAAVAELSGIVTKTAGAHLEACAASPPPQRTGQRNRDQDALQALAVATAFEVSSSVVTPKAGTRWCAEVGFGVGDRFFVYWRNADSAATGPVDRISAINTGLQAFVVKVPAGIISETLQKLSVKSPGDAGSVHALVVDGAETLSVAAIFAGRPSPQEVAPLAVAERMPIYATVPKQPGGRIQIFKPY